MFIWHLIQNLLEDDSILMVKFILYITFTIIFKSRTVPYMKYNFDIPSQQHEMAVNLLAVLVFTAHTHL